MYMYNRVKINGIEYNMVVPISSIKFLYFDYLSILAEILLISVSPPPLGCIQNSRVLGDFIMQAEVLASCPGTTLAEVVEPKPCNKINA